MQIHSKWTKKETSSHLQIGVSENLKVHLTFHVSLLKLVSHDASRPKWKHELRPQLDLIENEPKFEVETIFNSKQLWKCEWEYLVKSKDYYALKASWVNELNMDHAQKTTEVVHN